MSKVGIVRAGQYDSLTGYHRLAAGICHQAFEDLKTAYVMERGYRRKVADGEEFNSRGLEDWFRGDEYFFLTGYENGDTIIKEAKRQAEEYVKNLKGGKLYARAI